VDTVYFISLTNKVSELMPAGLLLNFFSHLKIIIVVCVVYVVQFNICTPNLLRNAMRAQ